MREQGGRNSRLTFEDLLFQENVLGQSFHVWPAVVRQSWTADHFGGVEIHFLHDIPIISQAFDCCGWESGKNQ